MTSSTADKAARTLQSTKTSQQARATLRNFLDEETQLTESYSGEQLLWGLDGLCALTPKEATDERYVSGILQRFTRDHNIRKHAAELLVADHPDAQPIVSELARDGFFEK